MAMPEITEGQQAPILAALRALVSEMIETRAMGSDDAALKAVNATWRAMNAILAARWVPPAAVAEAEARGFARGVEAAAQVAELDCDWTRFGRSDLDEQWDGGPDAVRDYRIGIRAARAIAAAIRQGRALTPAQTEPKEG